MSQANIESKERREYFRLPDHVSLKVVELNDEQFVQAAERFDRTLTQLQSVSSSLAATNAQMARSLERIRPAFPELSGYLESLNDKVELVIKHFTPLVNELDSEPTHTVSLSGNGFAYTETRSLEAGAKVEIRLLLFPEHYAIFCLGRVVRCELSRELPTPHYDVGIEFIHIIEADRDLIMRHLMKRQSEEIRRQRDPDDA